MLKVVTLLRTLLTPLLAFFACTPVWGQILMSGGDYFQDFDSLATSGTANVWSDNTTLPGWYAAKTSGGTEVTTYRGGDGSSNAGAIWSLGIAGVSNSTDRALGSIASGTPGNFAYGLRLLNDTGVTLSNITVSYTGEQWRNGGNTSPQTLAFSYRISATPISNADAVNANAWTSFPALSFVTPIATANAGAIDGNAAANRAAFAPVLLSGVTVAAGEEIFLRWLDPNDSGNDHGFGIDDLVVSFSGGSSSPSTPQILTQPESQAAATGDKVQFFVLAAGNPSPVYQWQFNGSNLTNATAATLNLSGVTTNQAGAYRVIVSNTEGSITSAVATLVVTAPVSGVSVLTYNVRGNGATDWSTNAVQVLAIARQLQYLAPDIITFNEIPFDLRYEMTNFVAAFLPGYQVTISTGTDGYICSAIASRYPITRSAKWLDGADLKPFGYTNTSSGLADNFTRDLFEAEIAVPGFARHLHVFTTHLKATSGSQNYDDDAAKRAAEAAAITNFLATSFAPLYPYDPYLLAGDMNDTDTNTVAIQRLLSPPTGLRLTNPKNPVTGSINTYSTADANPASRLDYVFPNSLLAVNIKTGMVFRSSLVNPLPPGLNSTDSQVASDHYPVLMSFNNPYDKPFQLLSIYATNSTVALNWESVPGQTYAVESSAELLTWSTLATNIVATGSYQSFVINQVTADRFFRVSRMP